MKVSVSLVTFNHERFVGQALDGILMQQADFDFDIVVGDDCSTDSTRAIIRDYQQRFPERIRTIFPDRNLGDAGRPMFVETIKQCRGSYVAMLDGDDYWTAPDKLQRQADFLDAHPDCSLCYHDVEIVADGAPRPSWRFIGADHPPFMTTQDLLWSCAIPSCSPMIRREVMDEFPAWFFTGPWADLSLYLMASERGRLGLIDRIMGAYRVHPDSVWSSLDDEAQILSFIAALDGVGDAIKANYTRVIAHSKAKQYLLLANEQLRRRALSQCLRSLKRAVTHHPTPWQRGYLSLLKSLIAYPVRDAADAPRSASNRLP